MYIQLTTAMSVRLACTLSKTYDLIRKCLTNPRRWFLLSFALQVSVSATEPIRLLDIRWSKLCRLKRWLKSRLLTQDLIHCLILKSILLSSISTSHRSFNSSGFLCRLSILAVVSPTSGSAGLQQSSKHVRLRFHKVPSGSSRVSLRKPTHQ
jgi:hypothetical protein